MVGFMNMSIVDYESKDNTCDISKNESESDDEFPDLNIYEKIQLLLFLNQNKISSKPRPIPYIKEYH